jgi:hypothetical protein
MATTAVANLKAELEAQRSRYAASRRTLQTNFKVQRYVSYGLGTAGAGLAGVVTNKVKDIGSMPAAGVGGVLLLVAGEASGISEMSDLGAGMLQGYVAIEAYNRTK